MKTQRRWRPADTKMEKLRGKALQAAPPHSAPPRRGRAAEAAARKGHLSPWKRQRGGGGLAQLVSFQGDSRTGDPRS